MNQQKRQELLSRAQRSSRTVGKEIPDELTVQGATLNLNELIFECKRLDTVPEQRQDEIEELIRDLQRERLQRKHQIENGDITIEEGKELVRSIQGIERAINALESITSPAIGEQLRQKQLDDARDLLSLIERANG